MYILPEPLLLINTKVYFACYFLTDLDAVIFKLSGFEKICNLFFFKVFSEVTDAVSVFL